MDHFRELPKHMGTKDQVHVAVGFPDFLGHLGLLGHAPAQADQGIRVAALHVDQGPHVAEDPLLGVLPDGAGVDDDDPGLLLAVGEAEAHFIQIAPDALGVGLVLLAAVGIHKGQGLFRPLSGDPGYGGAVGELFFYLSGGNSGGAFHRNLQKALF